MEKMGHRSSASVVLLCPLVVGMVTAYVLYFNSGAFGLLTFIQAGHEIEKSVVDTVSIFCVSMIV